MNIDTSFFFTELCVITPDISCRSLIQIELQMQRWRTKWRPCKGMAVSRALIFHFKCYSILHFAICQLLCWAFLLLSLLLLLLLLKYTSRTCQIVKSVVKLNQRRIIESEAITRFNDAPPPALRHKTKSVIFKKGDEGIVDNIAVCCVAIFSAYKR